MTTKKIQKTCAQCGKLFVPKTVTSVYCSGKCSDAAYRKKKAQKKEDERLKSIANAIPEERQYISIPEAIALYGVAKSTLYRLIRQSTIPAINLGTRLLRISRTELEQMFPARESITAAAKPEPVSKLYSLEPEDCYTIGEIATKFGISDSTVYKHIRKFSIPTRQIGNFVYAPKTEIDNLYYDKSK